MLNESEIEDRLIKTLKGMGEDFDILDKDNRKDFIIEGVTDLIELDDNFILEKAEGTKIFWEVSPDSSLTSEELEEIVGEYNQRITDFVFELVNTKTELKMKGMLK